MIQLSIYSLSKEVFVGKAKSVSVPAVSGRMQVLPGHIPLITPLMAGDIVIDGAEKKETIPVVGGILEVKKSEVVILAEF
ncbi:MAG: hypothetical protein Q7R85_00710 [bacterium]|nr:hypothetical protein [bacterium]